MPSTFPEVWLKRVIFIITSLVSAQWLDAIPELDVTVVEMGSGSASELNAIHIPVETFEADVLINNTTYPIASQAFEDGEVIIQLDKYQTKVTTLSDDQIMGASYPKIDSVTGSHTRAMLKNKFKKAIHALAPAADTTDTPILVATGTAVSVGGRNRLTYADIVAAKDKLDQMDCPEEGRRLVLSTDHYNDLLVGADRNSMATLLADINKGKVAPMIAGFEIYSYLGNPYFELNEDDEWEKKPFGAVVSGTDRKGSIFFLTSNVAKKTGATKQYFAKAENDPENQTNRLNYRHYFIAMPMKQKYCGAIV
jgi:hypothetical protein